MKKFNLLLVLLAAALTGMTAFTACSDDDKDPPGITDQDTLSVDPKTYQFASGGENKVFKVNTNAASWDAVEVTGDWYEIEKGTNEFTVKVTANTTNGPLSGSIKVTAGEAPAVTINFTQVAAGQNKLSIDPTGTMNFTWEAGSKPVDVNTDADQWEVDVTSENTPWLTVEKNAAGDGFDVKVTEYSLVTTEVREGTVKVTAGTATPVSFTVRQTPKDIDPPAEDDKIEVDPTELKDIAWDAAPVTVDVTTEVQEWNVEVTEGDEWMEVNKTEDGKGFTVTFDPFDDPQQDQTHRTGKIKVSGGKADDVIIEVSQEAKVVVMIEDWVGLSAYNYDPDTNTFTTDNEDLAPFITLSFEYDKYQFTSSDMMQYGQVTVETEDGEQWLEAEIRVSLASSIGFTFEPNYSGADKRATVTVSLSNRPDFVPVTFTYVQSPGDPPSEGAIDLIADMGNTVVLQKWEPWVTNYVKPYSSYPGTSNLTLVFGSDAYDISHWATGIFSPNSLRIFNGEDYLYIKQGSSSSTGAVVHIRFCTTMDLTTGTVYNAEVGEEVEIEYDRVAKVVKFPRTIIHPVHGEVYLFVGQSDFGGVQDASFYCDVKISSAQ